MKPKRAPIIHYSVSYAIVEIKAGRITMQKQVTGSAELLSGSPSLGVIDHIYAVGWLSAKQVTSVESLLHKKRKKRNPYGDPCPKCRALFGYHYWFCPNQ